jgi:hypothetical protein
VTCGLKAHLRAWQALSLRAADIAHAVAERARIQNKSALESRIDAQAEIALPLLHLCLQIQSFPLVFQVVFQAQLGHVQVRNVGVESAELNAQLADALFNLGYFALKAGFGAVTHLRRIVRSACGFAVGIVKIRTEKA